MPEPSSNQPTLRWIVKRALDIADRLKHDEPYTDEEYEFLAWAIGYRMLSANQINKILEECFGITIQSIVSKYESRN